MIPTHKLVDKKIREIRVIKLGSLSQYNTAVPHRHDYIELFFFNEGRGVHDIDFVSFDVEPKSVHLVSAGRVHRLQRDLNSQGWVILFHPSIFDSDSTIGQFLFDLDCYDVNDYTPIYHFDTAVQHEIATAIESLWNYHQSDHSYKHQFIFNKLSLICLHCIEVSEQKKTDTSKDQELYVRFRQHLRHKFKTQKKVKDYADILGVTPRKLNEIVTFRTGLSVRNIIQRQIILEAKRLLNSGLPSKEIAFELNFDDPAHFSKFFKNQTGESPSEFQKSHV